MKKLSSLYALTCEVSAYGDEVLPKHFTLHSEVEARSIEVSLNIWSFGEQDAVEDSDSISIPKNPILWKSHQREMQQGRQFA